MVEYPNLINIFNRINKIREEEIREIDGITNLFSNSSIVSQIMYWFPRQTTKAFKTTLNKINWQEIPLETDS